METRVVRGVPWNVLGYAVNKGVRVLALIVLARLLLPADFGLFALALVALALVNVFSDLGLGAVIVVRQDLDRRQLGTALSLMLATGAAGGLLLVAAAPLAAVVFDEPRVTPVLAVLAVTLVLNVFAWFYAMVLQRELEFRRLFACTTVQTLAYVIAALALAAVGAGVWALVAAEIAGVVAYAAALMLLTPYRVTPAWDRAVAGDVFRSGRGFLAQGGLAYLQDNTDRLVIGGALGTTQFGLYAMAYRMAELPYWGLTHPIAMATFPGFARMRERGEDVRGPFLKVLRVATLATLPVGLLLSAAAEPFVQALLGERWEGMIGVLAIMGLWAATRSTSETLAWFLNAIGESVLLAKVSAGMLVLLLPTVVVAAAVGGLEGVAWAVVGNTMLTGALLSRGIARRADVAVREQLRALRVPLLAAPWCWGAATLAESALGALPPAARLALVVASGLVAYCTVLLILDPRGTRAVPGQVRGALRPA
jgi:PST family polysaccharide transporter